MPPPCSHNVPLQHGLLTEDASVIEGAQVNGLEVPIQDELGHSTAQGGRVLQPMSTETCCQVHVVYQWVQTHDAVLVKRVVVIKPRPCS